MQNLKTQVNSSESQERRREKITQLIGANPLAWHALRLCPEYEKVGSLTLPFKVLAVLSKGLLKVFFIHSH